MKNIDIELFSDKYKIHKLEEEDIEDIFKLSKGNALYYEYCPPFVTREEIREDMISLPPNTNIADKYYVGFYDEGNLIAELDLIDGYPIKSVAFIGLFMMDISIQNKGIGTQIINDVCKYLKSLEFKSVQLAWVKGNPQAEHFWIKNNFKKIKETSSNAADTVILAERIL